MLSTISWRIKRGFCMPFILQCFVTVIVCRLEINLCLNLKCILATCSIHIKTTQLFQSKQNVSGSQSVTITYQHSVIASGFIPWYCSIRHGFSSRSDSSFFNVATIILIIRQGFALIVLVAHIVFTKGVQTYNRRTVIAKLKQQAGQVNHPLKDKNSHLGHRTD